MATSPGPAAVVHEAPTLVASAVLRGEWARCYQDTCSALAVRRPVADAVVFEAAVAFRHARALESGDRLRSWLGERGLDADDWIGHVRRQCARSVVPGALASTCGPVDHRHPVWVDAACSGLWDDERRWLARAEAGAREVPPAHLAVDEVALDALVRTIRRAIGPMPADGWRDAARRALRAAAVHAARRDLLDDDTVARVLRVRALDWSRYLLEPVRGGAPREVAAAELAPDLVALAHAGRPGAVLPAALLGAPEGADGWRLVAVRRPRTTDSWVRDLVVEELLDRRLDTDPTARPVGAIAPAAVADAATSRDRPRPARRRRRGAVPVVLQVDETDCGVACLAMLARHHGRHVEIAALRDAADADRSGTSLAGLTEAGALAGLSVEGFELSAGALDGLALPAIAHVDADHWVVVERVGTGHVDVVDPAAGPARLERSEFAQRWTGFVAVVTPVAPAPVVGAGPRSRWRWLVPLVRARRRAIAGALALTVLGVALELAVPVLVQRIVDSTVRGDALRASLVVALLFSVAGVIALDTARERLLVRTAVQIDASMLDLVTGRLLQLPVAYFRRRRAGDVERRITGLGEVRRVVLHQGIEAFTAVLLVVGCGLTIAVLSPLLGVVFAAVLLANAAIMRASVTRVRPMFAALEESFGRYASRQLDLVRGIETVRVHGAERAARQRMRVAFDTLRRRTEPARLALVTHQVRTRALGLATTTAFVLAGAREAHAGRLSIGGYVAVLSLVALATPALVTVIRSWDDVQMSSVLLERIREVVEHEHSDRDGVDRGTDDGVDDRVDARTPSEVPNDASVVVRGLEVRVGRRVVLSGIDLDVAAGRLVAIVGRSGSGKSTLLRVLAGIEAPTSGTVHLGGAAIERIEPIVLRSHLGAVLQQPYVFDGTIAENVGFAEPHTPIGVPDEQAVADALWAAALDELVAAMPLGLATRVGEGGRTLAGGEAQRLALARALHRRPRVLLLDEPTSALDPEAEELVRARLRATAAGRTTFLVTHRLRVAADADEILVLDHGRVVERGPHDELLAADGVYAHLWRGGSA